MRKDKTYIFKLRQEGKSLREIQKITGVSRGTLCAWFKDIEWSKHVTVKNTAQNDTNAQVRLQHLHHIRRVNMQVRRAVNRRESFEQFEMYKNEPLFNAGLMLYMGHGIKKQGGSMRFSTASLETQEIFIKFCRQYMNIELSEIRIVLYIREREDIEQCQVQWSNKLTIPVTQFYKPQIVKGKGKPLQFGTGTTIIVGTYRQEKILHWIDLVFRYYIEK